MVIKEKQKKKSGKKKNRRMDNIYVLLGVGTVIVLMFFALGARIEELKRIKARNTERAAVIEKQLKSESEREKALEEKREYYKSREYIEDLAKEKLGLIYPDEVILKPSE